MNLFYKFINTILILGITQGISTWLYMIFLPKTFFFLTVFSYRDLGMCLAVLVTRLFSFENNYVSKIFKNLSVLIVANQFYRFEAYHMQNYITNDVISMNYYGSLLLYFMPFAISWTCVNLVRRLCIDWKIKKE
ncbi:hypothetical protein QKU48_gp0005 [Fadolivirus algeromassiliense]|jgi:hypothetical protein|uniref:Uncharacterized protein n=1 Tax=Fadolivirus FV1/VV64 TaxID=3070911 RepID=A0A7D3QTN8_9VIRU|nr:hypothetical protein QKU48_gp0005 [Fadolivirus algeromassiliense]QKF93463.1 hypothetical protein Fadolivirus_1_5 [Fadolivirus FV1/VV64]